MATIILRSAGAQLKNNVIDANFVNINTEVEAATAAIIVNAGNISTNTTNIGTNTTNIANKVDKTTATAQAVASTLAINGDITIASGSIVSTSGAISFGNENLSTTGTLAAGTTTVGTLVLAAASITDTSGSISFGNENLSTTGTFSCGALTSTGIDDNATAVAITVNASEQVGIGTDTPTELLHLESATAGTMLYLKSTADGTTSGPDIVLSRDNVGAAANDIVGAIYWMGDSTEREYGHIEVELIDVGGIPDGYMNFYTLRSTPKKEMWVGNGVVVGTPTGDNNGFGSLNAQAVYDDNVLLTCYVFDQVVEGDIVETKWDDKVPDRVHKADKYSEEEIEARTHEPMRKFRQRMQTAYDPLDIDKYAQHWKDKKHLTSMPNEDKFSHGDMSSGEWIQRLIETVEIQAVHIESLNQRVKLLESN